MSLAIILQPLIYFIDSSILSISYEWNHTVYGLLWLASVTWHVFILYYHVHIVLSCTYCTIMFSYCTIITLVPFYRWIIIYCMSIQLCWLVLSGYLVDFLDMNNAAKNIHVFVQTCFCFSWAYHWEQNCCVKELLNLISVGTANLFFQCSCTIFLTELLYSRQKSIIETFF